MSGLSKQEAKALVEKLSGATPLGQLPTKHIEERGQLLSSVQSALAESGSVFQRLWTAKVHQRGL